MMERRNENRSRTLLAGKIAFNGRRSVIDCIVRNLSDNGACLQITNSAGMPTTFELVLEGEARGRSCKLVWLTDTRAGVEFADARHGPADPDGESVPAKAASAASIGVDMLRGELLALRAALDDVPVGIVLLDADTRAQFINRAFRKMWRLPDTKAESRPPFVALMYHGRDTSAYAVPPEQLDSYVAERVAQVRSGDPRPLDLRLANGEIIRLQCTVLPSGGRMLCYTYVTDIVQHSDELAMLKGALDQMQSGIVLLDAQLNVQFMNSAVRQFWEVSDDQADRKPPYAELVNESRKSGVYGVAPEELDALIANRLAVVRAGDPMPMDVPHKDGRIIRSQCSVLPNGGRMVSYNDVTDLVSRAREFERLAGLDAMTGLCNRREFERLAEAEWARFQRYLRPLSLLLIDIDQFKEINDRFGHEAGDKALKQLASVCSAARRTTDLVARLGGDEFAILLPETDLQQALVVAERIRHEISSSSSDPGMTASIGIASATLGMSGTGAFLRAADKALYEAKAAGRNCVVASREETNVHELRAAAE
ncbi:MAG: diguanylate cyclase [Xanthobacteraceae bacterium]